MEPMEPLVQLPCQDKEMLWHDMCSLALTLKLEVLLLRKCMLLQDLVILIGHAIEFGCFFKRHHLQEGPQSTCPHHMSVH